MSPLVRLRAPVVLLAVLILQCSLGAALRIDGAHPDLMVALVVAVALNGGPARGALVGFVAGIGVDLVVDTPFGLSALTYVLVGYMSGLAFSEVTDVSGWFTPIAFALASAGSVVLFAVLGTIFGQTGMLTDRLGQVVIVVGLVNALLAPAARKLMSWALPPPSQPLADRRNPLATSNWR
jgi:rod shape-determining protein MreD